jgi:hypothetical protein
VLPLYSCLNLNRESADSSNLKCPSLFKTFNGFPVVLYVKYALFENLNILYAVDPVNANFALTGPVYPSDKC